MTTWHIEGGATALLHDVEAETLQITRLRKAGCRNPTNLQVCGPRQPPTVQKTLQIPRFHAECCKTQVLGPYAGGVVVANREPGSYIYLFIFLMADLCPIVCKHCPCGIDLSVQLTNISMLDASRSATLLKDYFHIGMSDVWWFSYLFRILFGTFYGGKRMYMVCE